MCLSALWAALSLAARSQSGSLDRTERAEELLILPALFLLFLSKKKTDQENSQCIHECFHFKRGGTHERHCWSLCDILCLWVRSFVPGLSVLRVWSSTAWRYAEQPGFESSGFTSFSVITGGLWGIIRCGDLVPPPFISSLPFNSFISKQASPVYNLSKTLINDISRILIGHAARSIHNAPLTASIT